MEKRLFFRADLAGLGKYHTGGFGRIGVYRDKLTKLKRFLDKGMRVLVYKQTILPVLEYADFVYYLCNKNQRDKLQRMQNRSLRECLSIYNPRDVSTKELHTRVNLNTLSERRMAHLLNTMFDSTTRSEWLKDSKRPTRNSEKKTFNTDIVHLSIYQTSPYFIGAQAWNSMPVPLHEITNKEHFKQRTKNWAYTYAS